MTLKKGFYVYYLFLSCFYTSVVHEFSQGNNSYYYLGFHRNRLCFLLSVEINYILVHKLNVKFLFVIDNFAIINFRLIIFMCIN